MSPLVGRLMSSLFCMVFILICPLLSLLLLGNLRIYQMEQKCYGWINLPALLLLVLMSLLLIVGVDKSAKVNAVLVVIKVAVVLLFIAVGFGYIQEEL